MSVSLSRASYNKLVVILGTLTAFAPLSIDMYLPGLPAIAREFGVPTSAVQQTLAVFFVGLSLGQALYGPISDRVGRRRPLLFGCALYVVACIGCALAPTIGSLIVLRLAQALGGCAGVVIARSVVRDLFDQKEAARMFSFLMLVMGLAPILAPLIGGQVLAAWGWRAIFVVLAGFGVLCVVMVLFGLPETLPAERRVQAGLGEALRVYGRLLTDMHFMGYVLASGLASACMFTYISGSPFVFIELNGVPPERYGLIFGMNALGLIVASQINRRQRAALVHHHGARHRRLPAHACVDFRVHRQHRLRRPECDGCGDGELWAAGRQRVGVDRGDSVCAGRGRRRVAWRVAQRHRLAHDGRDRTVRHGVVHLPSGVGQSRAREAGAGNLTSTAEKRRSK
jgi:Bcr/CflA subfamily drug resistance transporter